VRHDTATIAEWDLDDPAQRDGPPGLPLHWIAGAHAANVDVIADRGRGGEFHAAVTLVTCIARV